MSKPENEIFFQQLPEPDVEYEVHVLIEERWLAVDFGRDRETLMKRMLDPAYKYTDAPRRIVALHHKAQVVDWVDPTVISGSKFPDPT